MAGAIGGGNYYANINSQLAAKGPDSAAVDNARQTSGDTAQTVKNFKPKESHDTGEGVQLSAKALKSMEAQHSDLVSGHEHELAHEAGVDESNGDNAERQEIRKERADENYQHHLENESEGPEGSVKVKSPTGAEQVLSANQNERLEHIDDPDRHDPLGDIPESNLRAAENVFQANASQGLKQVAKLKPVPEAEKAAELEGTLAPPLSQPMGISEPGSDKTTRPVSMELPPETEQMASEQAAKKLQAGAGADEQMMVGGAATTNGKPQMSAAQLGELRTQRDQAKQYLDTTVPNLLQNYEKLRPGLGRSAQELIAKHENEYGSLLNRMGTKVSPEMVHYAAVGQAAQDNLDAYAKSNQACAQLMAKYTHDGKLDLAGYANEAQQIGKQAAAKGDRDTAFWAEDSTYSAALVSASSRYLDSQAKMVDGGELPGPLNALQHGKVDLDQASAQSPDKASSIQAYSNLSPQQAWQAREAGGDALGWAFQRLNPQQQQALQTRVERRVESGFPDDDDNKAKKKESVDRSMVWAQEMQDWSSEQLAQQAADDPQRTLMQMVNNQADSYVVLRNVMDQRGWG